MKTYIVYLYSQKDFKSGEFTTRAENIEQAIQEALNYYNIGDFKVTSVFERVYIEGENK